MKAYLQRSAQVPRYLPGQVLLETDRLATLSLQPLSGDVTQPGKSDDLPALKDVLTFLKFTPEETKNLVEAVQSTIKIVGGIVSVVGAVTSVVDLMTKLGVFGPQEDKTQVALAQIGSRLNQIYGYLVQEEFKGLYLQAVEWRSARTNARNALRNAQISPTTSIVNDLVARTADLDTGINQMLDPANANIAFLRSVYNYTPVNIWPHWIDAATPPFMTRTDGQPINYADPAQELQSRIWDAGHFIDVLFSSLAERMLVTVTIEPAFRSTAYDRDQLKRIVTGLTAFINAWRGAMLVASPSAGLNGGYPTPFNLPTLPMPGQGLLQSPYRPQAHNLGSMTAPPGIVLGAVDPVTGVAAWDPFWEAFDRLGSVTLNDYGVFQEAWGGGYDVVRAKDPAKALAAAEQQQAQMLDEVVGASGIVALMQLRTQLQLAASEVTGSEFAQLPNALFRLVKSGINFDGSPVFALRRGPVESVDLGQLTPFAVDPTKKYDGTRYFQETEKIFRFRMAQRTRRTQIQLGYRLRIGETDIPLVPFSRGGYLDSNVTPFPTEPIAVEVHETTQVYEVRQSQVFSYEQEDLFEAGEPLPTSPWSLPGWKGRLFIDKRIGDVAFAVDVRFEHDSTGQQYTGDAIVTIRNLEPEKFPAGYILPVTVFETHMDGSDPPQPSEYVADSMTIHMVPSFLVMGRDFFDAYWETLNFLAKTVKGINDRFKIHEGVRQLTRPNPDPAWAVQRQAQEATALVNVIDAVRIAQPEAVAEVIQQLKAPSVRN